MQLSIRKLNFFKSSGGFTLVEVSISLVVLGLILGFASQLYQQHIYSKNDSKTKENVSVVFATLEDFRNINGRYPCPSSLSLPRTDPNYGSEGNCADKITVPLNGCDDNNPNYCIQTSPNAALTAVQRRVRIGAIPFRALGLREKDAYDAYGNRLFFVVSEPLTDQETYNDALAGVRLVDGNGQSLGVTNIGVSTQYFRTAIFSPGRNRIGGFNREGVNLNPCDSAVGKDQENCDFLSGSNNAVFAIADKSDATGANYFDDVLVYNNVNLNSQSEGWRNGDPVTGENPNDLIATLQSVRVGDFTPPTDTLSVSGSVHLINKNGLAGNLIANAFCDSTDITNCFRVEDLNRTCPDGEYVTGVSKQAGTNNKILCSEIWFGCPTGQILRGKNADGSPDCFTPAPDVVVGDEPIEENCEGTETSDAELLNCPQNNGTQYQKRTITNCNGEVVKVIDNKNEVCCDQTKTTASFNCGVHSKLNGVSPQIVSNFVQTKTPTSKCFAPVYTPSAPSQCQCKEPESVNNIEPVCGPDQVGNVCATGTITYSKNSVGTCTQTQNTLVTTGTCKSANFILQTGGSASTVSGVNPAGIPSVGSLCGASKSPRQCKVSNSGNSFTIYSACTCSKQLSSCTPPL